MPTPHDRFGVKDEFGKHTAGETGSSGWGGGDGRTEKPWFVPGPVPFPVIWFSAGESSVITAQPLVVTSDLLAFPIH